MSDHPPAPRPIAPPPRPRALGAETGQPPPLPPPPRRRKPWLPIVVGVVVLALLVGGGVVLWRVLSPKQVTEAPVGPATTASDAVAGYLHALREGDLATALGYGQSQPTDTRFVTDEVLERSRELAPISDIRVVANDDPQATHVQAGYRLGDQEVEATFGVVRQGDEWRLLETTAHLSVADLRTRNLPIELNGVPVGNSNELTVLPGGYAFGTGMPRIDYGDDNVTTVSAPGSQQRARELTPTLTQVGRDDLITASRASLENCLTQQSVNPPGCPFGAKVPEGSSIDPKTVQWELVGDPFAVAQPLLEWTDHGEAQLPVQLRLIFRATVVTGSSSGRVEQELTNNSTAVANIDDDRLQISWRG